jgi:glycosyltransferase involved in cell wall biosynthesis
MQILYFYQYFSTPNGAWGTRVFEFASEWVKKGHEVTVITSVYSKSDLKATKFIEDQYFSGIKVKIINIQIDNRKSKISRIWTFLQYAFISSYFSLKLSADIIIVSSGPITVGIPGLLANIFRNKIMVFESRDLWPEGAIELGVIKNSLLEKLSYWFIKLCYKRAKLVVALSPGMKTFIENKYFPKKVISITNAANIELFGIKNDDLSNFEGVTKYKYAIYTGNIGEVNNSEWLYNAALILKSIGRDDIKIVLIGDGQLKNKLINLANENNVTNFLVWDLIPKKNLVALIQNSLVSLVPLSGSPILDTSSPNKFFESIAAGVPIIQNTNGWMKDFLQFHNAGFTLNPNSPNDLADKLIELDNNIDYRVSSIDRLKKIAADNFNKNTLALDFLNELEKIAINK